MALPRRVHPGRRRNRREWLPGRPELESRLATALVAPIPAPAGALSTDLTPSDTAGGTASDRDRLPSVPAADPGLAPTYGSGTPAGLTPEQIRTAFGIDAIAFEGITGDGAGQTIAIVVAYDHPSFVNSTDPRFSASDLARFDRQFNLADPPSFTKLNQYGDTTGLPDPDPSGPASPTGNWAYEAALDVEWAHAIAPGASILLVECNSNNYSDLYSGVVTAANLPGVSVVSMSWGAEEFRGVRYWERYFQTPPDHPGVTFVASAGDAGSPGVYPAFSPNVVAVGGTTLALNSDGSYQGETAWSGSGGGVSSVADEPGYQRSVQDTGFRTIPDVAFLADPSTGVAICDSFNDMGEGPWHVLAGTSLGAPVWAGLIAIANQGRVGAGGSTLDGSTETLPALYALPAPDFHDVTSGGNGGFNAGPGYDLVTGRGTPRADLLVPDLASYGLPDRLVMTTQPPRSIVAGTAFRVTVAIESAMGTLRTGVGGTVAIAIADPTGHGRLDGWLTAAINQGVATFDDLTIDQAGDNYSLVVGAGGFDAVLSTRFSVRPAEPAQLEIGPEPSSAIQAGSGFDLSVLIEDRFGNIANGFDGTIRLALSSPPGGGTLGGTLAVTARAGVAQFSGLSIVQAGIGYTIEATSDGLSPAFSSAFDITPSPPARLVMIAPPPGRVTAGAGFGLSVAVEDAYGNLVSSFEGGLTVSLAGGPDGSTLGGGRIAAAERGVATYSGLSIARAGTDYTLQVTCDDLMPATSPTIRVIPAAPAQLVITSQPSGSVAAGERFGLTVAVEDSFGNLDPTFDGPVRLSLTRDADGPIRGVLTTTARGGLAAFADLSIAKAGTGYAIQATSDDLASRITGAFSVTPTAPSQLTIIAQPPATVTAGQSFGSIIAVRDRFGNPVPDYDGMVMASLGSGSRGGLLGGAWSVIARGGIAEFSGLSVAIAGTGESLIATAEGLSAVTTDAFRVDPASAVRLLVTVQPPATTTAGKAFEMEVVAQDPFGNVDTSFQSVVTAGIENPGGGEALGGRATATATAVAGVARFSGMVLTRAGSGDRLEVTSPGLSRATTDVIIITAAPPSRLVVTSQPTDRIVARRPFGFTIAVVDPFGNLATDFRGRVLAVAAGSPGRRQLRGTRSVPATDGIATFADLTLKRVKPGAVIAFTSEGLSAVIPRLSLTSSPPRRWLARSRIPVASGPGTGLRGPGTRTGPEQALARRRSSDVSPGD